MKGWSLGVMGTLTSELLFHPDLQRCSLKLMGAILVLKPELLYITLHS